MDREKSTIDKWGDYFCEGTTSCSFELGYTIGQLNNLAINYWGKFKKAYFPANPQKFNQQLPELLASKLNQMPDVTMDNQVFDKLTSEMYKFLSCSLASNRSPDEIILGLQSDTEMREEVVDLLISKIELKTSLDNQRIFLDRILSGDEDLRALLNKQKEKKGFPHNI
ncbi:hypothetical protein ACFL3G_06250 [Planctomycetota bacterium]